MQLIGRVSPSDMYVFKKYYYDQHADPSKTIYVGITDFLAYSKGIVEYVEFRGRIYRRARTSFIPSDMASKLSCVQEYHHVDEATSPVVKLLDNGLI